MSDQIQTTGSLPVSRELLDTVHARILGSIQSGQSRPVECPLTHRFTPGMYIREIFMPAGSIVLSKIHKTEHPYVVSKGRVTVYIEGVGVEEIVAPHTGITRPGTRRLLFMHEDTIWTTFHCTVPEDDDDPEKVEARIIEQHENPRIGEFNT